MCTDLQPVYSSMLVGLCPCHGFTKVPGHTGGFYHLVCRHGVSVYYVLSFLSLFKGCSTVLFHFFLSVQLNVERQIYVKHFGEKIQDVLKNLSMPKNLQRYALICVSNSCYGSFELTCIYHNMYLVPNEGLKVPNFG